MPWFDKLSQKHNKTALNSREHFTLALSHMFFHSRLAHVHSDCQSCVNHSHRNQKLREREAHPRPSRNTTLRQLNVPAFGFHQQTQFRDWSLVLPALSTNHASSNFSILPRVSRHDPSQWPHASRLVRFSN